VLGRFGRDPPSAGPFPAGNTTPAYHAKGPIARDFVEGAVVS